MSKIELIIENNGTYLSPAVLEGIDWSTERRGVPGKLTFTVLQDTAADFTEGNAVKLQVNGKPLFYGFIFSKKTDKKREIQVTAYDQIRYLLNKDTYVYTDKTVRDLIQMMAEDFGLKTGELADTRFRIASRVEDNASLLDMIQNALDITLQNTGEMFVLYDDSGKLTLKSPDSMRVNIGIDEETGENFDYTSSIDSGTYNRVKLSYDNEETGKRDIYVVEHGENINRWGVLQYFDTLKKGENGEAKAAAMLSLYNAKSRTLKISKAFGDTGVRAGSLIAVKLNLGDIRLSNFMLVEKCVHTFNESEHWMDLTLRGGEINGG